MTFIPLQDLPLFWQGRANALSIIDSHAVTSDAATLGAAHAYEKCAKELRSALAAFKNSVDSRLNDHLCEMKAGYDDSIVGFNEAWGIVSAVFQESDTSTWQPIETAPKDGTHILAYRAPIGIRATNLTNPPTVVHWFDDPQEPGFYTSVNELAPDRPFMPTHWMPLPEPPSL